jgi:hypothetical protein
MREMLSYSGKDDSITTTRFLKRSNKNPPPPPHKRKISNYFSFSTIPTVTTYEQRSP